MIKKADIFIIAIILLTTLLLGGFMLVGKQDGNVAVVTVKNAKLGRYPLSENRTIKLDGNTVVIENGKAFMKSADCRDKICVSHTAVSAVGECIVCLPHEVVVKIAD